MKNGILYTLVLSTAIGLPLLGKLKADSDNFPNDTVLSVATQKDGKILLGGKFSDFRMMRRNSDGTLDSSFTATWEANGFNGSVQSIAVQENKKILVGGDFTRFDISLAGSIVRLNEDGLIDEEFAKNAGTGFDDRVTLVRPETTGKIWVAGYFNSFNGVKVSHLARLNEDGSLDTSFTPSSQIDSQVLAVLPRTETGQVLLGGSFSSHFTALDLLKRE